MHAINDERRRYKYIQTCILHEKPEPAFSLPVQLKKMHVLLN